MTHTREQKGFGSRTEYVSHMAFDDAPNEAMCKCVHAGDTFTENIFMATCKRCRVALGLDCKVCGYELEKDEHEDGKCMPCFLKNRRRHYYADDDRADLNPEV